MRPSLLVALETVILDLYNGFLCKFYRRIFRGPVSIISSIKMVLQVETLPWPLDTKR